MEQRKYEVLATLLFRNDFDAEVDWLFLNSSLSYLNKFLDEYDSAVERLTDFPEWCASIEGTSYRWFSVGKCVAVYRVDKAKKQVKILRLYNMAQDWRNEILNDELED